MIIVTPVKDFISWIVFSLAKSKLQQLTYFILLLSQEISKPGGCERREEVSEKAVNSL